MDYYFDFPKKYKKTKRTKETPLEPAKYFEKLEKDRKKLIAFLNNWFNGRIISNEIKLKLQSFGVLELVLDNKIEEAKQRLLQSV